MSSEADLGAPSQAENGPVQGQAPKPGQRPLTALIILTGVVVLFAAAVAIWMYWLQGSLPS